MSDGPWIKFYPSDWLTGTRALSAAESGVYITLIAMMYEKGAPLTLGHPQLARLCGIPAASFSKILAGLIDAEKVVEADGGLFNERVQKELVARQLYSVTQSNSAKARWEKDKQEQYGEDSGAMPNASPRVARQKSEIRNQKPEVEKDLLTDGLEKPVNSVGALSMKDAQTTKGTKLPNDWVLPKAWGNWALSEFPFLTVESVRALADNFRDYWIAVPGAKGRKTDWLATWRNRVREQAPRSRGTAGRATKAAALGDELRHEMEAKYGSGREADGNLRAPQGLLAISGKAGP